MKKSISILCAAILSFTAFSQSSSSGSSATAAAITGTGSVGYLPKFIGTKKIGKSMLFESGTFLGTDITGTSLNFLNYNEFLKVKRGSTGSALVVHAEYLDMFDTPIRVEADISYIGFHANQPGFRNWAVGKGFNNSNHFEIMYSSSADGPSSQTAVLINGINGHFGINTINPTAQLTVNGTVNFKNLPTSSAGLSSGDLYNDSGTLKIVP